MDSVLFFQILGGFFSLVGIAVTIAGIAKRIREARDHHFSWKEVEAGARRIHDLMRRQRIRPKTIVPTGRGGMVLAGLLVDLFGETADNPRALTFMVDREEGHDKGSKVVTIRSDLADFLVTPPQPVLLVSGLAETGRTFEAYIEWLEGKGVTDIWTATLAETGGAGHNANFVVRDRLGRSEISFPWNANLKSNKKTPA